MTPIETVQALVDALFDYAPLGWKYDALTAGRALVAQMSAQETAASRATECEQKQPNTDSLHLAAFGNSAACGDKVGALRGWQPIETAPDGTMILCANMNAREARDWAYVAWMAGGFVCGHRADMPTHWQPLPPPPLAAADEGMPK